MPLIEYKDRRQLPDEEATAIFDHMTKTGGSTLAGVLIPHYDAQSILVLSGQALHTQYDGIANRAHSFQFIHGHGTRGAHTLFPEWKKVFYLTLLRHPLKQWMSNYKKMVSRT